ncbi:anaerobic ribonucleoside-triphosphate reductase activating protein, partial [Faecalibacterium prausnitzii]
MTWNTPKPQEWKSEELSQGRIIDYKAFNFVDGEGVRNSLYVQGLTLLGGEPFLNTGILTPLVKRIRKELPEKDIWSWTGYTWEELMLETPDKIELLHLVDILVDGRFDITKKNLILQFRGSSNQRIIDVKKSLDQGKVVIWDKLNDG